MASGSEFGIDAVSAYLETNGVPHEIVEHPTRYSAAADARTTSGSSDHRPTRNFAWSPSRGGRARRIASRRCW